LRAAARLAAYKAAFNETSEKSTGAIILFIQVALKMAAIIGRHKVSVGQCWFQ
jgi:hypothetical protein